MISHPVQQLCDGVDELDTGFEIELELRRLSNAFLTPVYDVDGAKEIRAEVRPVEHQVSLSLGVLHQLQQERRAHELIAKVLPSFALEQLPWNLLDGPEGETPAGERGSDAEAAGLDSLRMFQVLSPDRLLKGAVVEAHQPPEDLEEAAHVDVQLGEEGTRHLQQAEQLKLAQPSARQADTGQHLLAQTHDLTPSLQARQQCSVELFYASQVVEGAVGARRAKVMGGLNRS
mmetsp:Transcript_50892/g.159023  ORF Transcript_50892/g.159023 Transcript_50892/m.159023 type:complete len:231 (+) Transcript_50892:3933-4625(+)